MARSVDTMTTVNTPRSPRPEWQCLYKGTVCMNVRTIKDDGEYHRFCPLHRSLAIRNQQRWHQRRRAKKLQAKTTSPSSVCHSVEFTSESLEPLSDADWAMLATLLLDVPTPQPSSAKVTSASPSRLKTQRQQRRAEQTTRLIMPYFHV